jgi:8-oxo-dGTP diphosphatase
MRTDGAVATAQLSQGEDICREITRLSNRRRRGGNGRTMTASLYREIACAIVIDVSGRFLLQQRDDIAGIVHPGKVTLFGGHREEDETFLQCVVREIHEELSYCVPAERFEHLASLAGGDTDVDGGLVRAEFFIVRDIPVERLLVTEGSLLIAQPDRIFEIANKLTPSARFAMRAYGVAGL